MTNNDLKQIAKVVDERINGLKTDVHGLKTEMGDLKSTVEKRVLPPLTYIETTLKANADQYVANQDHIGRLNKRLTTVEDKLDINPPENSRIPQMD